MWKAKFGPLWIATPMALLAAWLYLRNPEDDAFWLTMLAFYSVMLFMQLSMFLVARIWPGPVPDDAVRDLLERSKESREDWILVEFEPQLSLEGARQRTGSRTYSQEDRKSAFLMKARLISPTAPSVGFYFSAEKGYVLGNREALTGLLKKYGPWTLDNWRSLTGAALQCGVESRSLDGAQFVPLHHR
jgi:hypothetical protein